MARFTAPVEASDVDWALAGSRERVVRQLLAEPPDHGARLETMTAAAAELEISLSYLYKLLRSYKVDPRARSLVPKPRGVPAGARRLDERIEAIIEEEIQTRYLTELQPRKAKLMRDIQARCRAEGLTGPARRTVDARLAAISKREQVKRRRGPKAAADTFDPIRGECRADQPLELVQIDHTPADVIAIELETGEPVGRPFITLAIDVCTRMYAGVYLTFDPPSATSVACCLLHTVMDKEAWLTAHGLPSAWPVAGLPKAVHVDNAKEFHSRAFTRACEDYGIEVKYRPIRQPRFGGHVERRLGHLSQELHLLDGTTFSNVKERGAYNADGNACLTIAEIEWMVASIILEHNASLHREIGTAPIAKWSEMTAGRPLRMPANLRDFHRDFLPWEERAVQRDGIQLFGIRYWHDALLPALHDRQRVVVHYDPADLAKVYVRGAAGAYLEVPYRNLRHPSISRWEHRAAVRALRRQGRAGVDEAMVFEMILARRRRLDEIRGQSRRARLELARGAGGPRQDLLPPAAPSPLLGTDTQEDEDQPLALPYYETEVWDE